MTESEKDSEQLPVQPGQGKRIALVVGVDTSPKSGLRPLEGAVNDAMALSQVLQQYGRFEIYHDTPYLEAEATAHNIQQAIIDFTSDCSDDDVLLFYFSGHGVPLDVPYGKDVCLVTHDYLPAFAQRSPESFLTLKWLHEQLYIQTKAGQVVIFLDCCHAGFLANHAPNIDLTHLKNRYADYFNVSDDRRAQSPTGLRRAIVATSANGFALEFGGHGWMTSLILKALSGEFPNILDPNTGELTLDYLYAFLKNSMSSSFPDYLGSNQRHTCVMAYHEPPSVHSPEEERPAHNHLPYARSPLYQSRPEEFQTLAKLLLEAKKPARLGLTGIPGIGKSQLAIQFADWCERQKLFPDGLYWVDARKCSTLEDWRHSFANLARSLNFRPKGSPDDDISLSSHIAYYLAAHPQALLLLDNVENPLLVKDLLPLLAGTEFQCSVLYTSIQRTDSEWNTPYNVPPLPQQAAYTLLLPDTKSEVLTALAKRQNTPETQAAAFICHYLGYHPMTLTYLRSFLLSEKDLTLQALSSILQARGILDLTREYPDEDALLATFQLIWEKVQDEDAQKLFKLATYYPEISSIPLWLLGLAADLGQQDIPFSHLRKARSLLRRFSLIEYVEESQSLQLHSLVCDFGHQLLNADGDTGRQLLVDAGTTLQQALETFSILEGRAQQNYWRFLTELKNALRYIEKLISNPPDYLNRFEHYLDQESYLLASSNIWPHPLPGLLYQQIYNHFLEDTPPGTPLPTHLSPTTHPWLKQRRPLGIRRPEPERIFVGQGSETTCVALSPDAQLALLGSQNGSVLLLEVRSGRPLALLDGHHDSVTSVTFSPSSSSIVTASLDGTARLWQWESEHNIATFECMIVSAIKGITSIVFSPDDKFVLFGRQDAIAQVWERETGRIVLSLSGEQRLEISSVAFSPDGSLILTGSWDESICLWEAATGKLLKRFSFLRKKIWQGYDLLTQLENALTGEALALDPRDTMVNRAVYALAFSPTGEHLLAGYQDGIARLWEMSTGRILQRFTGHSDSITGLAFSPDGTQILTGSADGTVRIWQTSSGKNLLLLDHGAWVNSVAYASDGGKILTGSNEHLARLWNIPSLLASFAHSTTANSNTHTAPIAVSALAQYNQSDLYALTGAEDGSIYLWKPGQKLSRRHLHTHQDLVTCVAFFPSFPRFLSASLDGSARIWEITSSVIQQTHVLQAEHGISWAAFSPDSQTILTASVDHSVSLWKLRKGPQARIHLKYTELEHGVVTCATFSPDGHTALIGTDQGWLALLSTSRKIAPSFWQAHDKAITSLCYSPDGRLILSSAMDEKTLLWNVSDAQLLGSLTLQEKEVEYFTFSADSSLLLTSARRGGEIRLWQRSSDISFQLLGFYPTYNRAGAALFGSDNRQLTLIDMGGARYQPNVFELKIENVMLQHTKNGRG